MTDPYVELKEAHTRVEESLALMLHRRTLVDLLIKVSAEIDKRCYEPVELNWLLPKRGMLPRVLEGKPLGDWLHEWQLV
jgi:hypothetical protein